MNISPEYTDDASTPKDKWAFKTATQNLCAESQNYESQSGNKKSQSTNHIKEGISVFISWI